jgi:benzodiazapine receptor
MPVPMNPRPLSHQIAGLVGWLLAAFAAAAVGAIASADAPAFYAQLDKPAWAPPAAVFGPVWSVLYALMAVAAWLVWRSPQRAGAGVYGLFFAQLAVNALWSWLFFAWRQGAWAAAEVLLLLVLVACTALAFWRIRRLAGLLLAPYLLWVAFASALSWSVWQRNPAVL